MNWWRHVMALEARKLLAYRFDFWVTFLGQTLVHILIARALWQSIFASRGVTELNGFTLETMTLYYLLAPLGMKILTGENVGFVAREIYDGTFSRYLVYPLSAFQYKTITYLTHSTFIFLQLLLLTSLYVTFFSDIPYTATFLVNLLTGAGIFLAASITYLMMAFFIELLSLWVDNIWSLMVMLRFAVSFLGGGFIPLNFFPDWARAALEYTPFPYLMSLPVRTIMGLSTTTEILHGLLILAFWTLVASQCVRLLWFKGQRQFTGVGQ